MQPLWVPLYTFSLLSGVIGNRKFQLEVDNLFWSPWCFLRYLLPKSGKTQFFGFCGATSLTLWRSLWLPGFPQGGGRYCGSLNMVLYEFTNKELYKKAASTLLLPGGRTLVSPVGVRHNLRDGVAPIRALAGARTRAYTHIYAHTSVIKKRPLSQSHSRRFKTGIAVYPIRRTCQPLTGLRWPFPAPSRPFRPVP